MQSIERYGLVALLFLVVTIVAVLVWDEDVTAAGATSVASASSAQKAAAQRASKPAGRRDRAARRESEAQRVDLSVAPKPRGLSRAEQHEREEELRREAERAAARRAEAERAERQRLEAERRANAAHPPAGLVSGGLANTSLPVDAARTAAEDPGGRRARGARQERAPEPATAATAATPGTTGGEPRAASRYTVRPGDTLGAIAQRQLGTVKRAGEIVALNPGLDPDRIVVGQVLTLPGGARADAAPASSAKAGPRVNGHGRAVEAGGSYAVREGDSLWKIAKRVLGDGERWNDIARLNPQIDPNRLRVGQRLTLPSGASAGAADGARSSTAPAVGVPRPGQLVAANVSGTGSAGGASSGRVR